jgi:hypothetical protein
MEGATEMVSIWHIAFLGGFFAPVSMAMAAAMIRRVGVGGYSFAACIGIVIGLLCAVTMRYALKVIHRRSKKNPKQQGFHLAVMCVLTVPWIFFATYLSFWIPLRLL